MKFTQQWGIPETLVNFFPGSTEVGMKIRRLPIRGVPPGISYRTLHDVSDSKLGFIPSRIIFRQLSTWKPTGAYRLHLWNGKQNRQLIYKNSRYDQTEIPALENLGLHPGPPEQAILNLAFRRPFKYLPQIHWTNVHGTDQHYQYLMEDLATTYSHDFSETARLRAAKILPDIHRALNQWAGDELFQTSEQNPLIHYDGDFISKLEQYAKKNFQEYYNFSQSKQTRRVLDEWEKIITIYNQSNPVELKMTCMIHGDLNLSNILFANDNKDELKLIDWEWMGWGLPHADLVSIMKGASEEMEERSVEIYAEQDKRLKHHEHREAFLWCKLGRNLLDASFLSIQLLEKELKTRLNLSRLIEQSLHQLLDSYHKLELL